MMTPETKDREEEDCEGRSAKMDNGNSEVKEEVNDTAEPVLSSSSNDVPPLPPLPPALPKLYGRESQLQVLMNVFYRVTTNGTYVGQAQPQILTLLTGPSGTGKTALAWNLASYFAEEAYFVSCKFDQDPLSESYTPLRGAITDYFLQLVHHHQQRRETPEDFKRIAQEMQVRLSADYVLLKNTMPIVASIMQTSMGTQSTISGKTSNHNTNDELSTGGLSVTNTNNTTGTMDIYETLLQVGPGTLHHEDQITRTTRSAMAAMTTNAGDGDECFRFVIRTILQIVCQKDRPLIFFMDDLQWADTESLLLLEELLLDDGIQGLLLVGACRGNEVDFGDELAVLLRKLEDTSTGGSCEIVDVQVTNLDLTEISALIRDSIDSHHPNIIPSTILDDPEACSTLANFTHSYTHGNAFGTKQMVDFLAQELQLMTTNTNTTTKTTPSPSLSLVDRLTQQMKGKIDAMLIKIQSDDTLVALVLLRLLELPLPVRELMQACACLGKDFAATTIKAVLVANQAEESLQIAQQAELLQQVTTTRTASTTKPGEDDTETSGGGFYYNQKPELKYQFVHDKIQEASLKLIPYDSRPLAHVNIGRRLWEAMQQNTIEFDPELLVNQFRRGIQLVTEEEDRVALAQLCLEASCKSGISSSMATSTGYLELGLSLLPVRHWRDHYDLSLNLKCAAAEMNYAIGRHEETVAIVQEVVQASMNLRDQARAQAIMIYSLGSQNRIEEAMEASLQILKQLGEPIPRRVGLLSLLNEARVTKNALKRKSDSDLLALPHMIDPNQLAAVNILNIVWLYNFSGRPLSAALIAMRMVRRTVQNGLSAMSSVGFAAYGMMLSNAFGDFENGVRYGRLALQVYEIFTKAEWYCRVHVLVWGCLMPVLLPIRKCTPHMKRAGIAGLAAGDIEFAMLGLVLYTCYSIAASRPLKTLFQEGRDFLDRMKLHKQDLTLQWQLPLMQVVSTLTGDTETDAPAVLTGKFFNEEEGIDVARRQKNISAMTTIYYNKLTVAVTMGAWDVAEHVTVTWEKSCDFSTLLVPIQDYTRFMMALASLVQLHSGTKGNRQRRRRARRYLRLLRSRIQTSKENYEHRVLLLEAEQEFGCGRMGAAEKKYRQAIKSSGSNSFWMEQGLAFERLAVCMSVSQPKVSPVSFLEDAKKAYEKWGATAKVTKLEKAIQEAGAKASAQSLALQ